MIDIVRQINSVRRRLGSREIDAREARVATIERVFDAPLDDVWDACTNAERISRWFLPITGELRVGGRYQLEGNASGTIERCDPPRSFAATWEYRDEVSWIELRLAPDTAQRTRLELEHVAHVADEFWDRFGPGATGVGWELGLISLTRHLAGDDAVDQAAFEAWTGSDEGKRFVGLSSEAWRDASIAAGTDVAAAQAAAERTTAFYSGEGS